MSTTVNDIKYKKITDLAENLISQVKAEALVSLRFLDVALYKHKVKFDFNATIYTDGEYIIVNPYHIFNLYKSDNNLLLRAYLHVVLHCIFFHLFVDKKVDEKLWNLATDISVENIINEFKMPTLIQDADNPEIIEINKIKQKVKSMTAERIYDYLVKTDITDFEIERLSKVFLIDDHVKWYEDERKISDIENNKSTDNKNAKNDNKLDDDEVEGAEHKERTKDNDKSKNDDNRYDDIKKEKEKNEDDEEKGDEASNVDGDKNKSTTGDDENPDADSIEKSDINEDSLNEAEKAGGENVDEEVNAKNIDENLKGDEFKSIRESLESSFNDGKEKKEVEGSKNRDDTYSSTNSNVKKTKSDNEKKSSYNDWKKISERIKEDLLMFENMWGSKTHTIRQYIEYVNEEKYDYEEFLSKFAVMSENIELNDDEFDNVYYTFGLNMYKNIPLVEPLEYKESERIKDFVVAIDVSGSVKGELVEKFLKKTYTILTSRNNYFNKVNIHIVLCDAEIKDIYKIRSLTDLKDIMRSITLSGFGGTDFRPVFDYVDTLVSSGEFKNLKGLIYFTDGIGEYPKKPTTYDTAFVFIKDQYERDRKKISVPPWAIKLILEDVR